MRAHTLTCSSWHMVRKLDQVGAKMKKELTCNIDGCPYEITLEIVLGEKELLEQGYGTHFTEERIVAGLQDTPPYLEVEVNFKLWDYIEAIKRILDENDTNHWGVKEWEEACPFLFECDPTFDAEEELQKVRETWV